MRFASCRHDGQRFAALVEGWQAIPLAGIAELGPLTPLSVLADPPLDRARSVPLDRVTLRPVVPAPGKVICVGLNYRSHVAETGRQDSDYPVLFAKFASSLVGPYDPIVAPAASRQVDYEAEIAVVIGTPARGVPLADASRHVAGLTIANDVSMRDFQNRTHQWLPGKAWDDSTPVGPFLVTQDELPPPGQMRICLTLNGERLQDSTADLMIFDIPTLVSTISQFTTLLPGDLILTGTPGGVGMRRDPPVYLRAGDMVEVQVTGLGSLRNPVVGDQAV